MPDEPSDNHPGDPAGEPDSREVVEYASRVAEAAVFDCVPPADVADLDIRIGFEDQILDVDISITATETADVTEDDVRAIADAAVRAATESVDTHFEPSG